MAKQIIWITLLSVVMILFREQLTYLLDGIIFLHNSIAKSLHLIFADDNVGRLVQDMIALLLIPVICGVVVAALFWLVKRAQMPHIMSVIWIVWLVLLITMIEQSGTSTTRVVHNEHEAPRLASFFH